MNELQQMAITRRLQHASEAELLDTVVKLCVYMANEELGGATVVRISTVRRLLAGKSLLDLKVGA